MRLKTTLVITLATGAMVFGSGCGKKEKGKSKSEGTEAMGAMDDGVSSMDDTMAAARAPEAIAATGIKECDAYIKGYTCLIGTMPLAGRASQLANLRRLGAGWAKTRGPATRAGCLKTLAMWTKGTGVNAKKCFSQYASLVKAGAGDPMSPKASTPGLKGTGIPECDAYIKGYSCYVGTLPVKDRKGQLANLSKLSAIWAKARGPARKRAAKGCAKNLATWKKGTSAGVKKCFK